MCCSFTDIEKGPAELSLKRGRLAIGVPTPYSITYTLKNTYVFVKLVAEAGVEPT